MMSVTSLSMTWIWTVLCCIFIGLSTALPVTSELSHINTEQTTSRSRGLKAGHDHLRNATGFVNLTDSSKVAPREKPKEDPRDGFPYSFGTCLRECIKGTGDKTEDKYSEKRSQVSMIHDCHRKCLADPTTYYANATVGGHEGVQANVMSMNFSSNSVLVG